MMEKNQNDKQGSQVKSQYVSFFPAKCLSQIYFLLKVVVEGSGHPTNKLMSSKTNKDHFNKDDACKAFGCWK